MHPPGDAAAFWYAHLVWDRRAQYNRSYDLTLRPMDVNGHNDCVFCQIFRARTRPFVAENEFFFVVPDQYPVNEGHSLIIPKRHVSAIGQLTDQEAAALLAAVRTTQEIMQGKSAVAGFNIGVNEGAAAGQTIEHLHVHIIPRYVGDVENPRGGIRNFKPPLVEYR